MPSPAIDLVKRLDFSGAYISLKGHSLFLTSGIDPKTGASQPGAWFDIGPDPASPAPVCSTLPAAWQIGVAENHFFVCDYTKFLSVYEAGEGQCKSVAKLPMPSQTENIVIRKNLAYVANHTAGLTIVDISKPESPAVVSNLDPGIDCDGIALWNDCAVLYAHWQSRLVLVDISDPAKPRKTGVYQHTPNSFNQGEVEVAEGFAYCTAVDGLVIVNITDPANPRLAKVVPSKTTTDVFLRDGYAFVAATDGVHVLDVKDHLNAVECASFKQPAFQLAVSEGSAKGDYYLYTTNKKGPATVLRFHAPARQDPAPRH